MGVHATRINKLLCRKSNSLALKYNMGTMVSFFFPPPLSPAREGLVMCVCVLCHLKQKININLIPTMPFICSASRLSASSEGRSYVVWVIIGPTWIDKGFCEISAIAGNKSSISHHGQLSIQLHSPQYCTASIFHQYDIPLRDRITISLQRPQPPPSSETILHRHV